MDWQVPVSPESRHTLGNNQRAGFSELEPMNKYLDRFLTISTADPDDTRRRRTLNILLLGVGVISILALMITLLYLVVSKSQIENDTLLLIIGSIVTLAGVIIIYFINLLWQAYCLSHGIVSSLAE